MALDATATPDKKPDATPAADAGVAPADKAPANAADKASPDKAPAPDTAAGATPSTEVTDDKGGASERSATGEEWLDDETDGAVGEGKAEADDKAADSKDANSTPEQQGWRDAALKSAEAKLLKGAKSEDDKKAVASKLDRIGKQLARYGTAEAAILAGMEAQEKLRAGAKEEPPGPDASPEQRAQWREKQGLPVEAADIEIPRIELTTDDGRRVLHKWTEEDRPLHDSFRDLAFDLDLPQDKVNKAVKWQVAEVQKAQKRQQELIQHIDTEDRKSAREVLQQEFGSEFKPRIELVKRLAGDVEALPDGAGAILWNARSPEGHLVRNNPHLIKLLSDAALLTYGEGSLITGDQRAATENREAEIRRTMKENWNEYINKGLDKELASIEEKKLQSRKGRAA